MRVRIAMLMGITLLTEFLLSSYTCVSHNERISKTFIAINPTACP
jgi:hypothetical protein